VSGSPPHRPIEVRGERAAVLLTQPRGSPVVFPGAAGFLKALCIPDSAYSACSSLPRPRIPPPRSPPAAYSVKKALSPRKPPGAPGYRWLQLVDLYSRLSTRTRVLDLDLVAGSPPVRPPGVLMRPCCVFLTSFVSALLPFVGHYLVVALDV
jgi:hypothetical protein